MARILVVDPQTESGRAWQTRLVEWGHSVPRVLDAAADLAHAVEDVDPHLLFLSLEGDADGACLEAVRRWRGNGAKGLPLLILTSQPETLTLNRHGAALFPFGLLAPPVEREAFAEALRQLVPEAASGVHPATIRETLGSLEQGVIAEDLAGNLSYLNRAAEEMTGWSAEEALGQPVAEVFRLRSDAESGPRYLERRAAAPIAIETESLPLEREDGALAGMITVFRPAGDSRPNQGERSGPGDLETAARSITDPLFTFDAGGRITFLNPAAAAFYTIPREDILGRPFWQDFDPSIREAYQPRFDAVIADQEPDAFEFALPGGGAWLHFQLYPYAGGILALLRDESGRKSEEIEMRRIERLEGLSHLARGFSHDFNNLLTVIQGNLALARSEAADPAQERKLAEAAKAARQAQGLVHQIMTFARGGAPIKGLVPIRPLIRQIVEERETEQDKVRYEVQFEGKEISLHADPKQLRRLIENLLLNAEQAMNQEGGIIVRCRADAIEAGGPKEENGENSGQWFTLEIADTGPGIADEVARQAFDPFFTTREKQNATGLGLTVCEAIARGHGGKVELHSNGSGTVARVLLPMPPSREEPIPGPVTPVPSRNGSSSPAQPTSGAARILVLEDESLIRRLIHTTLASAGYQVEEAREGQAAIDAYRQAASSGRPYDLVIMDLTIEDGMGGVDAIRHIRELDPKVRAIVSSGYCDDPAMAEPARFGFIGVLPKPYQPVELIEVVDGILKRR